MLRFVLVISTAVLGAVASATAGTAADPAAVARIHGGIVDCVGCQLAGADLSNTCVKAHDLHGADFDGAKAVLMCMSYANFSGATFRGTDLSGANLAHANLDGADMTGAITDHHLVQGHGSDAREGPDPGAAQCGLRRRGDQIACRPRRAHLFLAFRLASERRSTQPRARMYRPGSFFVFAPGEDFRCFAAVLRIVSPALHGNGQMRAKLGKCIFEVGHSKLVGQQYVVTPKDMLVYSHAFQRADHQILVKADRALLPQWHPRRIVR